VLFTDKHYFTKNITANCLLQTTPFQRGRGSKCLCQWRWTLLSTSFSRLCPLTSKDL